MYELRAAQDALIGGLEGKVLYNVKTAEDWLCAPAKLFNLLRAGAHLLKTSFVCFGTLEARLFICFTDQTANPGEHTVLLDPVVTGVSRDEGTA